MYCNQCGAKIPDHSQKCPHCGAVLENTSVNAPVSKETADLIVRVTATLLSFWLIFTVYSEFVGHLRLFMEMFQYFSINFYFFRELLYFLLSLIPHIIYMGLAAFYIYTAVVWNHKNMDRYFGVNLVLVIMIFVISIFSCFYEFICYRFFEIALLKYGFKISLPAMIAFIVFYLIVALICPTMPLAKIKDAKSMAESLADIKDILPESKPVSVQPEAEPRSNKPVANKAAQNVQKPAPAANTAAGPIMLQTNRGVIKWFLLSLITCDIYALYQIHKMAKEMNICCEGDGRSTPGLIKLCLFTILTCGFYGIYYLYSLENRIKANAPRYGQNIPEGGGTILLWIFLGWWACLFGVFFAYHILFRNMNILFTAYNNEQMAAMNQSDIQGGY